MGDLFSSLTISEKLKAIMAVKGIEQKQLAELLKVTPETIRNRMESNKWFTVDINKIAETYNIDPKDLI